MWNFYSKSIGEETERLIFLFFLVQSALIFSGLGPAAFLILFKDEGHRVVPKFHLLVSDVHQGNEEGG